MPDITTFPLSSLAEFGQQAALPTFNPDEITEALLESEMCDLPHLATDQRFEESITVDRIFQSETAATATEALQVIPPETLAIHMVISGRFALWDFVPAVLNLAGDGVAIRQLHLATLGFSRKNIAELSALLDASKVHNVALLCSHYFKGTSNGIYEYAQAELAARSQRFASVRTHAKVIALQLTDGRTVTLESSANLRSCKNIEQVTVYGSPGLYRFHVQWMETLFR